MFILDAVCRPFEISGCRGFADMSIDVAFAPEAGFGHVELMHKAYVVAA
jgi:hypothetical protein